MIKQGDAIKIKPEWQDKGDAEREFRAVEDESAGRVRIAYIGALSHFVPVQVVDVRMIERAN